MLRILRTTLLAVHYHSMNFVQRHDRYISHYNQTALKQSLYLILIVSLRLYAYYLQPRQQVTPHQQAKSLQPRQLVKPHQQAKSLQPRQPVKPHQHAKSVQPRQPVKPHQHEKSVQPRQPVKIH